MYCSKCGAQNDDNAFKCVNCGEVLQHVQPSGGPMQKVPNYLAQAILVTLFCCVPFGIVAIVYAAQVNSKLQLGDYTGAVESSKKAEKWCWAAFGTGFGLIILYTFIAIAVKMLEL